ncbi:MAG: hypothetical protein LBT79_04080, partial [Elusimicrobiota bacterium]|nr:hypothetical protein [Elusimicrobiota bacterium]
MNENYHYFVVKTLACRAGFDDGEAQFIAAFSQQIDDFVFEHPVFLTQAPPQFFIDNGYAKKLDNNSWIFFPHSTGISTLLSVWSEFQKNTLVPFHFIPIKPLSEIDKSTNVNRDDYRCVIGSDKKAQMINNLAAQAVENVKTLKNNKSLMRLGMILHTYADTYSHCHYSGLHGWENNSFIFNVDNLIEPKNPVPVFDRIFYWLAPSIGHANTGHTPDICSYTIDLKMKNNINDAFSFDNNRSNSGSFGICSYNIFKFLCQANSQSEDFIKDTWSKLEKELLKAEPVADETDTEALTMHWKSYFSDIDYRYDKSQCFNLDIKIEGFNAVIAERVGISQK